MTKVMPEPLPSARRRRKPTKQPCNNAPAGQSVCVMGRGRAPLTNKLSLDKGPAWLLVGRIHGSFLGLLLSLLEPRLSAGGRQDGLPRPAQA